MLNLSLSSASVQQSAMTPGAGGFRFSQGPSAILEAEASGKAWVTGVAVMRIFGFVPKAVGPMYTEVSPDRDNARAVEARVVIELINISCILAILPPKRISFSIRQKSGFNDPLYRFDFAEMLQGLGGDR